MRCLSNLDQILLQVGKNVHVNVCANSYLCGVLPSL